MKKMKHIPWYFMWSVDNIGQCGGVENHSPLLSWWWWYGGAARPSQQRSPLCQPLDGGPGVRYSIGWGQGNKVISPDYWVWDTQGVMLSSVCDWSSNAFTWRSAATECWVQLIYRGCVAILLLQIVIVYIGERGDRMLRDLCYDGHKQAGEFRQ